MMAYRLIAVQSNKNNVMFNKDKSNSINMMKQIAMPEGTDIVNEAFKMIKEMPNHLAKSDNVQGTNMKVNYHKDHKNMFEVISSAINTYINNSKYRHLLEYSGNIYCIPKPLVETKTIKIGNRVAKRYTPVYGFNKHDIFLANNTALKGIVKDYHIPVNIDTVLHELVEGFYARAKDGKIMHIIDKRVWGTKKEEIIDALVEYIKGDKAYWKGIGNGKDYCEDKFNEHGFSDAERYELLNELRFF